MSSSSSWGWIAIRRSSPSAEGSLETWVVSLQPTYLRGIAFAQGPDPTVLAMVDALDWRQDRDQLENRARIWSAPFHQPVGVYIDTATLKNAAQTRAGGRCGRTHQGRP